MDRRYDGNLVLSPVVVAELFSSPNMTDTLKAGPSRRAYPRAASGILGASRTNRATLLRAGKKARLADSMIATCCLDHDIAIIARDSDYRHFTEHFELVVYSGMTG